MDPQSPVVATRPGDDLAALYRSLHRNPELSFAEHRTASLVADELQALGFDVRTGVGGTGVVGVLTNGEGPVVLARADMDALPVEEETGLGYASRVRSVDRTGRDVPVMHACGHDMHVACLVGAVRQLVAERGSWSGTLEILFQPAEELGTGARAVVDSGLFESIPKPVVVLGQHVSPLPAGMLGIQPGLAFAAADGIRITFYGRGGHGSRPETTVDPIVLAAAAILRLQTIVSRETSATDSLVLTIGSVHAGTKNNVIPDRAEILLSVRTFDAGVRDRALGAIRRIAAGEAAAAGAPREPEVDVYESFPSVINDPDAAEATRNAFVDRFGAHAVIAPGAVTGSEDIGILATALGAACSFWLLGGADPVLFADATTVEDVTRIVARQPSNHSPQYAPVIEPTLGTGVAAIVTAARRWLATT